MKQIMQKLAAIWQNLTTNRLILISSNSPLSIEEVIAHERLRQARTSFNLAIATATISFGISLIGAILLLSNDAPQGGIISAVGMVSSVRYFEFAENSNDRLDQILNEFGR